MTARNQRSRRKMARGLSKILGICLALSLFQPALASAAECTIQEHAHRTDCYQQITTKTEKTLVCEPGTVVHQHDALCTAEDGITVCTLKEIHVHAHGSGCYSQPESHVHEDVCYITTDTAQCGDDAHAHGDGYCRQLSCGQAETNAEPQLVCTVEELVPHTHGEDCYTSVPGENGEPLPTLTCQMQELTEHAHSETCFTVMEIPVDTTALTCTDPAPEHTHNALCYGTWELTCQEETHIHTEDCVPPEAVPVTAALDAPAAAQNIASAQPERDTYTSTREFIDLNLYDYTSAINSKWTGKGSKYPGFQWNGGAYMKSGTFRHRGIDYIDFGNSLITDYEYGSSQSGTNGKSRNATDVVTRVDGDINEIDLVGGVTDRPVGMSTGADVLQRTLKNGYPALKDGTSLDYLFTGGKQNSQSIDGLFKKSELTGRYAFNSRETNAQYSGNMFTRYKDILTPNFILYPFGNFLPFNDIHSATQVSAIDTMENYIANVRNGLNPADATQKQLDDMLQRYLTALKQNGLESKNAKQIIQDYFSGDGDGPTSNTGLITDALMEKLYNIDWDTDTNFFFGMDMSMNFMMPKDGMTGKDNGDNTTALTTNSSGEPVRSGAPDGIPDYPMEFYFTGDDDVWVYIDDVLFLDLTGIHRHVGGKIDFVKGEVSYYKLDTAGTGDATSLYKTYTFAQLLRSAGKSTEGLENGTFRDYSTHELRFFYMERGSGSSVCRIEFNFPLLRKNTIRVAKEVTIGDTSVDALGSPTYRFQILKEDKTPFFGAGISYNILDTTGNVLGTETTAAEGIFELKSGQQAEFTGIPENQGGYYVRELLDPSISSQYGQVSVNGTVVQLDTNAAAAFASYTSPRQDLSNGSTYFLFENQIAPAGLGRLEITKSLTDADGNSVTGKDFTMHVTLDGKALSVGTVYTVDGVEHTVKTEGKVIIPAGKSAVISHILAGASFVVSEEHTAGYTVTLHGSGGVTVNGNSAAGTIPLGSTAAVTVHNKERVIPVSIPVTKRVSNPISETHTQTYHFAWAEVADIAGTDLTPAADTPKTFSIEVTGSAPAVHDLDMTYRELDLRSDGTLNRYYKIYEVTGDDAALDADQSIYVVHVHIARDGETGTLTTTQRVSRITEGTAEEAEGNQVTFTNTLLGALEIRKELTLLDGADTTKVFTMQAELSGPLIKAGMTCTLNGAEITPEVRDGKAVFEIPLKNGKAALLGNIPAGSRFTVTETAESSYGYNVAYQVNDAPASQTATGTVPAKAAADNIPSVSVLVTNQELAASVPIEVIKHLTNPDGNSHTYDFQLTEVDENGAPLSGGRTETKSLNMTEANGLFSFTLDYRSPDLEAGSVRNGQKEKTFFYQITETTRDDLTVDADESVYLVEVTLRGSENTLDAAVTAVYRNGSRLSDTTISFTNTLLGSLILEKKVVGAAPSGLSFDFTLQANLFGDFPATLNGSNTTVRFENGEALLKLCHKDVLAIYGIPQGTAFSITESPSEYAVRYAVNSGWSHSGSTAAGTVTTSGTHVLFKNYSPYGLPQTGQLNWPIPVLAVLGGTCLTAGSLLLLRRKKGKHEK